MFTAVRSIRHPEALLSILNPLSVYSVGISSILALERTVVPEEELIVSFKIVFFKYSVTQCIMKNVIASFKIFVFKYSDNQCIMKIVIVSFKYFYKYSVTQCRL